MLKQPVSDVDLRVETPADLAGIRAANLAAFPTDEEANLVEGLRADPAWVPDLSWVAVADGAIVGYAVLSRCYIDDCRSLALGPVAVTPERQRQGIGQLVTWAVLDAARQRGEPSVVVLGHADYYPRFGFTRASAHGIGVTFDVPDEALMAMSLDDRPLPSGTLRYAPPFGV